MVRHRAADRQSDVASDCTCIGASSTSAATPARHAATLQWLTTINDKNSFETLSTIISALAMQHAACDLTWQPVGPARGLPHIANLTDHFRQHQWRCGSPVNPSLLGGVPPSPPARGR